MRPEQSNYTPGWLVRSRGGDEGDSEQWTGIRGQGTGDSEQGTGNREQGTGIRHGPYALRHSPFQRVWVVKDFLQ